MDSPDLRSPPASWLRQLGVRLRAFWPFKMIGMTLGMTAFFVIYFQLLRHPQFAVTTVSLLPLDRWIAFQPAALPLYYSLWIYVSLLPALLPDRRELVSYGAAAVILSLVGFGIFLFWPTVVPASPIDWSRHPSLVFLKTADATGNACPSLHVAFAVFTTVGFERLLRQMGADQLIRALNGAWCLGIIYSTLAIRQHVALDALTGAALGALAGLGRCWFLPSAEA